MVKKGGKPSGAKTAYVCFLQVCREEHQKRSPNVPIVLKDFSKSCSEKWKALPEKDKKKFQDMAARDKIRFQKEMESYVPPPGEKGRKRKQAKDPNKPKRNLSAFFFFCNEKRPQIQKDHSDWKVGDIAKELGRQWEKCTDRDKYEKLAVRDKERYERDMEQYRKTGGGSGGGAAKKSKAVAVAEPDDDDELEDEEEDEGDYDDEDDEDDDE